MDIRAGRGPRLPRDGCVRRPGRAGRVHRDPRRRHRGAGRDQRDRPAGADVAGGVPRRHHELRDRRAPGPGLPRAPWPQGEDHARAARSGRGLLRQARRQDDPDRTVHRARARARPVHRGLVEDAVPAVRALQRDRDRPVGRHVRAARLLLLAVVRARRFDRRPRDRRVRSRRHGDLRRRVGVPAPARSGGAREARELVRAGRGGVRCCARSRPCCGPSGAACSSPPGG